MELELLLLAATLAVATKIAQNKIMEAIVICILFSLIIYIRTYNYIF